jgi:DNA-binding transcriptional LysR family regulator
MPVGHDECKLFARAPLPNRQHSRRGIIRRMSMQHTRFLRYVDAVARAGSIRRAAERLHVASSAVNRRILDLEEELGAPIFERLPRGVRLTAAGELFVAYVRRRLADLERVHSEIADLSGVRRGVVAIAGSQAVAHEFLPQAIVQFQQRYAGITFKVKVCDREEAVRAVTGMEVEAALVFNPPASREFRALAQIEQRMCALVAPDHPLARSRSVRFKDCAAYPIALPEAALGGRVLLEEYFARSSSRITPQLESNSFEMMRNFARASGGVCFQIQIGASGARGGMVAIPIEERGLSRGRLVLGALRGRVLPVASALFCEFLADRLASPRR